MTNHIDASRQPIVRIENGEAMADSRDVAAYFAKVHRRVLQTIRELSCSDEFRRHNFVPFKINDLTGETTSHVMMTKDGFMFLVLGFTGGRAAAYKERYIAQFNAMEAELRRRAAPMVDVNDPAQLRNLLLSYSEKAIELQNKVAELMPSKQALERIAEADGSLCITDAAKNLQVPPQQLFRWLRTHLWIYRRVGTLHDVAYQDKIAAGYLEHKVTEVSRQDGSTKVVTQVRVTPKGLARLAREFNNGQRVA